MTTLTLLSWIFFSFANAEPKIEQVTTPPVDCSVQFIADFDATAARFLDVSLAIDSKADETSYRHTVVEALNACHSFVETYVKIDPVSNDWIGEACTRVREEQTETILPQSHKAECEYLQRLLNRADQ
jgi:hypothetical protein